MDKPQQTLDQPTLLHEQEAELLEEDREFSTLVERAMELGTVQRKKPDA